jgi:hypothetical protein
LFSEGLRENPVVLEPAAALQNSLGAGLILPEIRGRDGGFDVGQFAEKTGFVKAPSADQWPARPGRNANAPSRPRSFKPLRLKAQGSGLI